jgi:hypothetical protein
VARIVETSAIQTAAGREMLGACEYLAVLAYPRDWSARDRFIRALARESLTRWKARHGVTRTPPTHRDVAALMPAEDARAAVGRGLALVEYRDLAAAAVVSSPLSAGQVLVTRDATDVDTWHRRRVSPSFTRSVQGIVGRRQERTFWRQWHDTARVLHLAMALRQSTHGSVWELIEDADAWLRPCLSQAERWRAALPQVQIYGTPLRVSEQIRLIPD